MSKILKGFTTKKGEKEFKKLNNDEKAKILQAAIEEKMAEVMSKEILKNILTGMELEAENVYNKYVKSIDEIEVSSEEFLDRVELMLSYFRKKHLEFYMKVEKGKEESKGGE